MWISLILHEMQSAGPGVSTDRNGQTCCSNHFGEKQLRSGIQRQVQWHVGCLKKVINSVVSDAVRTFNDNNVK